MKERIYLHLQEIREKGNYRQIKYIKPLSPTRIMYKGREYLNFCSNSYLSMQFHPDVIKAAKDATDAYGAGTCSSRSVSGSIDLYEKLEKTIAKFKRYRKSLVFNSGYLANIGIISTLAGEGDVIFSDELNHSSLVDSTRLSRAKKVIYRHLDMEDLEKKIKKEKAKGERFVVTETVFSMDGDVAPLDSIYALKKKYGFRTIIDEAHGTGVFGNKGIGIEEVYNLMGRMDVQMCTSGKSIGSFGAFVLADDIIIEYLINRARTFMYTTALPASALAASLTALKLISRDTSYKEELWSAIDYMRTNLIRMGFDLKRSEGPIIPIVVGEDATALMIQNMLMKKGVFLQAIRPPTVPSGTSRLRLNVIRGFTRAEMDQALDGLLHAAKKVGLIG